VTDASLLLGYLNPDNFAGGALPLCPAAARDALEPVAARLGLSLLDTAAGVHRVVNARMADQIRLMTIQRGHDPRRLALLLLGGAGPVHGVALAEELQLPEVLVPEAPGVLSAFGLLGAAIEHHHAQTFPAPLAGLDLRAVNALLARLDETGRARMREEDVPLGEVRVAYGADMRYVGQSYELEVPIEAPLADADLAAVEAAFHRTHARVYGYARSGQPVEFVNFRVGHSYPLPPPPPPPSARGEGSLAAARIGARRAAFPAAGLVMTPIFDRGRLPVDTPFPGPAIVEQPDTTTVIPPGWVAVRDPAGNLRLRRSR
jgi:N-methylhydantoinase A